MSGDWRNARKASLGRAPRETVTVIGQDGEQGSKLRQARTFARDPLMRPVGRSVQNLIGPGTDRRSALQRGKHRVLAAERAGAMNTVVSQNHGFKGHSACFEFDTAALVGRLFIFATIDVRATA